MNLSLSPIDANFWSLDTPTTHQAIASLCLLDRLPDRARLVDAFARIVPVFPRITWKVEGIGRPRWVPDPVFDLERQIQFVFRPEIRSREELLSAVSEVFSEGIDRNGPLWRLVTVSNYPADGLSEPAEPQVAVLFLLHHTLTDGLGGLELFDAVCSSTRDGAPAELKAPAARTAAARKDRLDRSLLRSLGRLGQEWAARRGHSPLNGDNSNTRRIHLTEFPLEALQASRRVREASLNDLMLTIVTGAVRRYHAAVGMPLEDLRIIMPISLRRLTERLTLGNRLTGVGVRLPVSLHDPAEQLRRIKEYVGRIKAEGSFGAYELMAKANAALPHRFRLRLCERAAEKTNFICTSVSAAARPRYLAGARIEGNYGIAALMRGQGIAFAFTRYAKKMCFSAVCDPRIVQDPHTLLDFVQESGAELLAHR